MAARSRGLLSAFRLFSVCLAHASVHAVAMNAAPNPMRTFPANDLNPSVRNLHSPIGSFSPPHLRSLHR